MNDFDPNDYGPVFSALLAIDRRRELGAGSPDPGAQERLLELSVESAFGHLSVQNPSAAQLCLSGVWLLYDFLDESHTISQSVDNSDGSFWHGIMHRREGDFSNAKYWFRRVGEHPTFRDLASEAGRLATSAGQSETTDVLAPRGDWDPYEFVDACQAAEKSRGSSEHALLQEIQRREWELLFDHCFRRAAGM